MEPIKLFVLNNILMKKNSFRFFKKVFWSQGFFTLHIEKKIIINFDIKKNKQKNWDTNFFFKLNLNIFLLIGNIRCYMS